MLYINKDGLTYRWNYRHSVSVFDGRVEVDAFSVGGFDSDEVPYSDFLAGVVNYSEYLGQAAYYSSENAF